MINPAQTSTDAALAIGGATIGGVGIGDSLGDVCDDNGTINAGDFGGILADWQEAVPPGSQRADLDGNGVLNAGDFGAILASWQQACT